MVIHSNRLQRSEIADHFDDHESSAAQAEARPLNDGCIPESYLLSI
jgi:hypothetical protein